MELNGQDELHRPDVGCRDEASRPVTSIVHEVRESRQDVHDHETRTRQPSDGRPAVRRRVRTWR